MSKISPEAQAIIDRLAAMDPANPRQDKAAIERAITAYLTAFGLPQRPFVWVENARAGYALATERGAAARDAAPTDAWAIALDVAWEAVEDAARLADWDTAWDAGWRAAKDAAKKAAWDAARGAAWERRGSARGKPRKTR